MIVQNNLFVYKKNKQKDRPKSFNLHPNKIVHMDKILSIYIIHTSLYSLFLKIICS